MPAATVETTPAMIAVVTAPTAKSKGKRNCGVRPPVISIIIRLIIISLCVWNNIDRRRRNGLISHRRLHRGIRSLRTVVVGRNLLRRRLCRRLRQLTALVQHGIEDDIGNSLLFQINDFGSAQSVNRPGILDVSDNGAVADFRLRKLQNLRHAVGQLRCGLVCDWRNNIGSSSGIRILRHSVSYQKSQDCNSGNCHQSFLKVLRFHNQHLII